MKDQIRHGNTWKRGVFLGPQARRRLKGAEPQRCQNFGTIRGAHTLRVRHRATKVGNCTVARGEKCMFLEGQACCIPRGGVLAPPEYQRTAAHMVWQTLSLSNSNQVLHGNRNRWVEIFTTMQPWPQDFSSFIHSFIHLLRMTSTNKTVCNAVWAGQQRSKTNTIVYSTALQINSYYISKKKILDRNTDARSCGS